MVLDVSSTSSESENDYSTPLTDLRKKELLERETALKVKVEKKMKKKRPKKPLKGKSKKKKKRFGAWRRVFNWIEASNSSLSQLFIRKQQ